MHKKKTKLSYQCCLLDISTVKTKKCSHFFRSNGEFYWPWRETKNQSSPGCLFSHFQLLVWSNKKVSNIIVSELAKKDSTTQCFVWMIKVRVLPWTYFLIIVPLTCHRRSIERTFWNLRCKPFQLKLLDLKFSSLHSSWNKIYFTE